MSGSAVTIPRQRDRGRRAAPRPLWRVAAGSFVPERYRGTVDTALAAAPTAAVLALQIVLTVRLHNIANMDEALYIDAGHAILREWGGGAAAPEYGTWFSGHPYGYPLLAAVLDTLGGLRLARLASLAMMLGATLCVGAIARALAPQPHAESARLLGMLCFGLSGAVLFTGNLATYDAACVLGVAVAARLAVTGTGVPSAVGGGLVLAAAATVKYTGGGFLPLVAALALFAAPSLARGIERAIVLACNAAAGIVLVLLPSFGVVGEGLRFTTLAREAQNLSTAPELLTHLGRGIGVLLALAVAGAVLDVVRTRSWRRALLAATFVAAALAVPASQLRMLEYTSFNKHLAFSALFLAPLAAQLVTFRPRIPRLALIAAGVYLLTVGALYRSQFMFTEWPDSTRVVQLIQRENRPGTYLGVGADAMAYYSKDHPALRWEEPWVLFGAGPDAVTRAVRERRYAGFVYTSGSSASAQLDADVAHLAALLRDDPAYELAGSWPKHPYDENRWYVYLRR